MVRTLFAASTDALKGMASPLASVFLSVTTEPSSAESSVFRTGSLKETVMLEAGATPVALLIGLMVAIGDVLSSVVNVIFLGEIMLPASSPTVAPIAT